MAVLSRLLPFVDALIVAGAGAVCVLFLLPAMGE